jgi:hypothetical protein
MNSLVVVSFWGRVLAVVQDLPSAFGFVLKHAIRSLAERFLAGDGLLDISRFDEMRFTVAEAYGLFHAHLEENVQVYILQNYRIDRMQVPEQGDLYTRKDMSGASILDSRRLRRYWENFSVPISLAQVNEILGAEVSGEALTTFAPNRPPTLLDVVACATGELPREFLLEKLCLARLARKIGENKMILADTTVVANCGKCVFHVEEMFDAHLALDGGQPIKIENSLWTPRELQEGRAFWRRKLGVSVTISQSNLGDSGAGPAESSKPSTTNTSEFHSKHKSPSPTSSDTARGSLQQLSALVQQLVDECKFGEAADALEQFFASPALKDQGSARVLDEARQSHFACQRELARQNHPAAARAAAELQAETQKQAGYPIRVTFEDYTDDLGLQMAWAEGRDHHQVVCRNEPKDLQPYELASALLRIQAETEACRAGKLRFPNVSRQQIDDLLSLFDPKEAQRLADEGGLWITLNPHPDDIALAPLRGLLSSAPWMLVDARLRQRFPVLRPAQFLARSTAFLNGSQAREDRTEIPPTQRLRERVINAVDGLNGLYLDWLFGGVTDFAARCRGLDGFDLAKKLWQHWQSRFPAMQAGDEFAMLDDFAEILGLAGRFGWINVPSAAGSTPKPPPHEATGL